MKQLIFAAAVVGFVACGDSEKNASEESQSTNNSTNGSTSTSTTGATTSVTGLDPDLEDRDERTACDLYCQDYRENCREQFDADYPNDGCYSACPNFPEGAAGDESGNTLACRRTQTASATEDPAACSNAGLNPTEGCVD